MLGSANVLTLSNANTFAGNTTVGGGTLKIGMTNALPVTTGLSISGPTTSVATGGNGGIGATLDVANSQTIDHFNGSGTGSFITLESTLTVAPASGSSSSSYGGTISGSGQLVINGASGSKVALSVANTYTGGTIVNGGQLGIHNGTSGSALGTGALTVNSGGRIEGGGQFTGALTLNSGSSATLDPKLTVGATTINGGVTFNYVLGSVTGTAGVDNGLLAISAAALTLNASSGNPITIRPFTFNGGSQGALTVFDTTANYSWNLTSGATSLSGFAANAFIVDTANFQNTFTGTFSVGSSGNDLVLNYTGGSPIPEPAALAAWLGACALGGALWSRKKTLRA